MEMHTQHSSFQMEIAITGMSGRFPGARNVHEYWQNIQAGIESISRFSKPEQSLPATSLLMPLDSNYIGTRGVIEDIEFFDPYFFGFNLREAEILDPQQRLFLECAWEALENAGYSPDASEKLVSVYAGSHLSTYFLNNLYLNRDLLKAVGSSVVYQANVADQLATRVSYKLNLKGPSITVQTACSTSLVAVHMACQSLLNGECDLALAGGVCLTIPQEVGYSYTKGGIYSPDGHCRAFDAQAQGTVFSNGLGIIVLRRLEDALNDRDYIYGTIKGSAVNNDGAAKVGYTAPSVDGQSEVIAEAFAIAGIKPETISYIEAHGTGTVLGDPIEIEALTKVFRSSTDKRQFCAIGSVKTNIGHLDTAAGIAGLIKATLMLKHKVLPPSLHFKQPNPNIDFNNSPFYVNTASVEWRTENGIPLRAGVSAFGVGGTNAHIIVEEAPPIEEIEGVDSLRIVVLSAKTKTALETLTQNIVAYLKQHPYLKLVDVAYTLQVGRSAFSYRRMVVCNDIATTVVALESLNSQQVFTSACEAQNWPVIFMFPPEGVQYAYMALELYEKQMEFREQVDHCLELLKPHIELNLHHVLYPKQEQLRDAVPYYEQAFIAQPLLFVIEYTLAKLWMRWGVQPTAMIGFGVGEYVAACLSGVFSLEEALALVVERGRLAQQFLDMKILNISLTPEEICPLLCEHPLLVTNNGPFSCIVSGPLQAVAQLENDLAQKAVSFYQLSARQAFNSELEFMKSTLEPFTRKLMQVHMHSPQMAYLSSVTGTWITPLEATDPGYWVNQLFEEVNVTVGLQELSKSVNGILLEVGPRQTLCTLASQYQTFAHQLVLPSLPNSEEQESDLACLMRALGQLWVAGVKIDWSQLYVDEQPHRMPLPTYPFERRKCWVGQSVNKAKSNQDVLGEKLNIQDWFYIPSWKRSSHLQSSKFKKQVDQNFIWLIFVDECGVGVELVKRLEQDGQVVTSVIRGEKFGEIAPNIYSINPQLPDDYKALFTALCSSEKSPNTVMYLWEVGANKQELIKSKSFEKTQDLGFYSLLFLTQALGERKSLGSIHIGIVSNNLQEVTGQEALCPEDATVLGLCRTIPQEYAHIVCSSIDIVLPDVGDEQEDQIVDQLITELTIQPSDRVVAFRGNYRWVQIFEPIQLQEVSETPSRLREGGVYLIAGGLGGVGFVLAEYLAHIKYAKLVLIGRTVLPAREEWQQWIETHDAQDELSRKIKKVMALETMGAEVLVVSADIAAQEQVNAVFAQIFKKFGKIHGVIHAAGIAGGGVIQSKTPEVAARVLAPKVRGTIALSNALRGLNIDFFVLCSSINSITGRYGLSDYCSANAFLDSFALYSSHRDKPFTIAINWDTWQEVGMAVDAPVPNQFRGLKEESLRKGILPEEGVDVFSRILSSSYSQVIVSTKHLPTFIEKISQLNNFSKALQGNYIGPSKDEKLAFWNDLIKHKLNKRQQ